MNNFINNKTKGGDLHYLIMNKTTNKMSKTKTEKQMVSKYLTNEMLQELEMVDLRGNGKKKKCKFILTSQKEKKQYELFETNSSGDNVVFSLCVDKYGDLCIEVGNHIFGFSKTTLNYNEGYEYLSPGIFDIVKSQIKQMTDYLGNSTYPNWK